jgi:hypothetical protein
MHSYRPLLLTLGSLVLSARVDLHRLDLAEGADRWYGGSGATQAKGTFFGYAGRATRGATRLGTVLEGSADVSIARRWSISGYAGTIAGGDAVKATFAGDRRGSFYVENVLAF